LTEIWPPDNIDIVLTDRKMKSMSPAKQYHLQSEPGHFYTGHLRDGTQAFMSLDYQKLVAVLFDAEGTYLKSLVREISKETQNGLELFFTVKRGGAVNYDGDEAVFNKVWEELDRWAEDLGFVKGVISVQKFSLPEFEFWIQDLPSIYQEILQETLDSGGDMEEDIQEDIRDWQEVNDYVLVWGQEYDINREGEVVST
jgi:hypothetical protein